MESIRSTFIALGRCGLDNLLALGRNEIVDATTMLDTHINGMVDYTLWFIISHWSYQRYFDDTHFLTQEWRVIKSRLTYLLNWCSDAETGWFIVKDHDRVFIDWTSNTNNKEKITALQILWWHALDCGISLAQEHEDVRVPNYNYSNDILPFLIERQSKLETSYLLLEDIQLNLSQQSHILGVVSGLYKRLDVRACGDWWCPDTSDENWHILRKV